MSTYAATKSLISTAPLQPRRKRRLRRRTGTNACVRQLLREIDAYLEFWAAARS